MFSGTFQGIVDTYGVANYKEANPGLFTIITFPFLFGIMYGDIFHGSVLLIGAIYMLLWEEDFIYQRKIGKMGEIFSMAFGGRYLVLLMGIFAIFCGSVYNDCASIPLNVYGSKWQYNNGNGTGTVPGYVMSGKEPYPWGLDPEWSHKANSLQFVNSMKMKFSVVVGVIQMTFGIILGLTNDIYFGDSLSIFFEFLPRICFMLSTFGYMILMILLKMCTDWSVSDAGEAPNLIQTMIKMFLSPGSKLVGPAEQAQGVAGQSALYNPETQAGIQTFLLIVAIISIPIMLFPKALIKHHQWKTRFGSISPFSINEAENVDHDDEHEHSHDHRTVTKHFQLSDELITTGIHTIEFVLGCVSNTASYLRLWALSLAHAELSEVFWNKMIMQYGLNMKPLGFVGFAVWACATTGVLLCMDVLECFLHALRLHWVEFQNKFYQGEGYKFQPFKLGDE
jgi:V-type H+-transporting ATPase subunit a